MTPTDDQTYNPGRDTNDVMGLPYVDHGPEIIARDHAPEPARIDQALRDAGAPAADRWTAHMNAHRTSTFGASETPTRVSPYAAQDAKLMENIKRSADTLRSLDTPMTPAQLNHMATRPLPSPEGR